MKTELTLHETKIDIQVSRNYFLTMFFFLNFMIRFIDKLLRFLKYRKLRFEESFAIIKNTEADLRGYWSLELTFLDQKSA